MLEIEAPTDVSCDLSLEAGDVGQGPTLDMTACYSDLLVEYLRQIKVKNIFGVPGGAIEPFFDGVARQQGDEPITLVISRHETGAAFMADGYARETQTMGVCCATTGPGATNLITGVASAYADDIPMLVITAQTALPKFGKQALQDSSSTAIDTVGMFRYCTKFNTLISHPDQFEHAVVSAIMAANTVPKGPAHLSVPSDIFNTRLSKATLVHAGALRQPWASNDHNSQEKLQQALFAANRIVILLGDNCDGASRSIIQFAETFNIPVISGPMGKRWINEKHPLYCGVFGFSGHDKARRLLAEQKYDLLLAVGTRLSELSTNGWAPTILNEKLIHIDSTSQYFNQSSMARLHVLGVLPQLFTHLTQKLSHKARGECWWEADEKKTAPLLPHDERALAQSNAQPLKPQRLFHYLSETLSDQTRIFIDAGNAWAWATHYMQRCNDQGYYRIAMGYGSMGWAIGSSIGSLVANPTAPHVCITGDGSYLMSGQELTVALEQRIPLVMIILNDSALGMVKHGQRLGGAEQIGFTLPVIDYGAMASSMGIESLTIASIDALEQVEFDELFARQGPTLIDVKIDPEEEPPMGERIKGLATSK